MINFVNVCSPMGRSWKSCSRRAAMIDYDEIFGRTSEFLSAKGIEVTLEKGDVLDEDEIREFEKILQLSLPSAFIDFCTRFADGIWFQWEMDEDVCGTFSVSSLQYLVESTQRFQGNVRDFSDDRTSLDKCVRAEFREEAFEIWERMKSWMPLCSDEEGESFCLDSTTGKVVYDQHDWFDGFGTVTRVNGLVAGESFSDFVLNWAEVCFQYPKSLWWGEFATEGSITWRRDRFDERFIHSLK